MSTKSFIAGLEDKSSTNRFTRQFRAMLLGYQRQFFILANVSVALGFKPRCQSALLFPKPI